MIQADAAQVTFLDYNDHDLCSFQAVEYSKTGIDLTTDKQTILDILKLSTDYLAKNKLPSPRLEAELLISHVLGCKRLDLYLRFDQPLKETELSLIRQFLKQRSAHEPVQHIIGRTEFYGSPFICDNRALIPRPDTEILVETVIETIKSAGLSSILDIGSGSGCIPIVLVKNTTATRIAAIDIWPDAIALATENAELNGVLDKIIFAVSDIFKPFRVKEKFDIVVSNPPYIALSEMASLDSEVQNFEPQNALTDGADGLSFYRRLAEIAPAAIKSGGWLMVEIGYRQAEAVEEIFNRSAIFNQISVIKDYGGQNRVVKAQLL